MFKKIASAAVLLGACSASIAAQPGSFYAGGEVGRSKITDVGGHETSFGGFVGYGFHPNFAVELGQRRLFEREFRGSGMGANMRVDQTSLSLLGSQPIGESFSVYGRLGAARLQERFSSDGFTNKDSSTKALYGVGLSYAITPAVAARVEVQKISQQASNLSTGLSFQF